MSEWATFFFDFCDKKRVAWYDAFSWVSRRTKNARQNGCIFFSIFAEERDLHGTMRFSGFARGQKTRNRMGALFFSFFGEKKDVHGRMRFSGKMGCRKTGVRMVMLFHFNLRAVSRERGKCSHPAGSRRLKYLNPIRVESK